jgi:hypothetical protein
MKKYAVIAAVVTVIAIALSAIWHVPYLFTLIGFFAWAFFGHLTTADDDTPGGWSNPDGSQPSQLRELAIKGALLAGSCALAAFPAIRSLGGPR